MSTGHPSQAVRATTLNLSGATLRSAYPKYITWIPRKGSQMTSGSHHTISYLKEKNMII
jgi:hypothetical protein